MAQPTMLSQCERQGAFTKQVGSTLYRVNVYGRASRETLEEAVIRLIRNDIGYGRKYDSNTATTPLQTGRLPERSSL